MQLTVALCTYNPNRDVLLRVIDAIVAQLAASPHTELLVVDNNSEPSLAQLGYLEGYPVDLLHESRQGLTAAKEAALQAARGDIVLFVDDDNILGHGYLHEVLSAFTEDAALGLLGGSIEPEYSSPPPTWTLEFEPQLAIRRYGKDFYRETRTPPYTHYFPVGAGVAVRRLLALEYVHDSDATARIEGRRGGELSAGEDIDLALFVLEKGYKLAVTGSLGLTHVIPSARLDRSYLARLVVGSLRSMLELEAKWSPRFGQPIFLGLSFSLTALIGRMLAASVLRHWSPRYEVKYGVFRTLTSARLALIKQTLLGRVGRAAT